MTAAALVVGVLSAPAAMAAGGKPGFKVRPVQQQKSVNGTDLAPQGKASVPAMGTWKPAAVNWPGAAESRVDLTGAGKAARQAAGTPVKVAAASEQNAPSAVSVQVTDHATAKKAGVDGLLVGLRRDDAASAGAPVSVSVDYSQIKGAFSADAASRLTLVSLPACALTTPEKAECRTRTAVPTVNDPVAGTLTATVDAAPAAAKASGGAKASGESAPSAFAAPTVTLLAAETSSSASSPMGDYKATSLANSGSWSHTGNTGGFSWNYPINVPAAPGGLVPNIALGYSSSSTDGRTASTNNQVSWIGEGWDYNPGFIERSYTGCGDDQYQGNNSAKTGDLCWKSDNATMSLNGSSTPLVKVDDRTWRPANDDGSRIERIRGEAIGNGDDDNEYWKVTDTSGTQFWFGRNKLPISLESTEDTNSAWTVPVYGNHAGEPGNAGTFAASVKTQAWRWNLDYVVDAHGNAMAYYYDRETNAYGQNMKTDSGAVSYVRGGYLKRIDYGLRGDLGAPSKASGQVQFTVGERCLTTCTTFDKAHATDWPDVPVDQDCAANSACLNVSPTFWSRKRLTQISTFSRLGGTLTPVDQWALSQTLPPTGDSSTPSLWLASIDRTFQAGSLTDVKLPQPMKFTGDLYDNRVDAAEGRPPMHKYRMIKITNETGGDTLISYRPTECVYGSTPAPESNDKACFPSYWTPEGQAQVLDWFHKYLVASVTEDDTTAGSGSESKVTSYEYLGGAAWHRDDSEFTPDATRTYNQFRGYAKVRTRVGSVNKTLTETEYFRGMDGDVLPGGGKRAVSVNGITDADGFEGRPAKVSTFDQDNGTVVVEATSTPWQSAANASYTPKSLSGKDGQAGVDLPAVEARFSGTASEQTRTWLSGTTWRTTKLNQTYDSTYGRLTEVSDEGDTAVTGDESCTRTVYTAPDTTNWLNSFPASSIADSTLCSTPSAPATAIGGTRTSYDGQPVGTVPVYGKAYVTKTEQLERYNGSTAVWNTTLNGSSFDRYGRPTSVTGEDNQTATTVYTPADGEQPTSVKVTNPAGQSTTTTYDGLRGLTLASGDVAGRTTNSKYDAAGRLTSTWDAGRATNLAANATFGYALSATAPTAVTTKVLLEDGSYRTATGIMDSFLRLRQNQVESTTTGRTITDTFYDSHGREWKTNADYWNSLGVSSTMYSVADNQIPSQTVIEFDGRSRPTASVLKSLNVEKWRTTTAYGGDWTSKVPPAGGTATLIRTNAKGQTVELRNYKDRNPLIGAAATQYEAITYQYDLGGRLTKVTDATGKNSWSYSYDLRGRQVHTVDPDKGTADSVYGADGRLATMTAAVGTADQATIGYTYDNLGRKRTLRSGSTTGTVLDEWTYDTAPGGVGLPATSSRYSTVGGATYTYKTTVKGYDTAGRSTGTTFTVPSVPKEEKLAGDYTLDYTYTPNTGLPNTTAYSTTNTNASSALPAETLTNGYDKYGQLGSVSSSLGTSYLGGAKYSAFGQTLQAQLGTIGGRVVRTNTFDEPTRRLVNVADDREASGPQTLTNATYTYNPVGDITQIKDEQNDKTVTDTQCFQTDWSRRLTEAWTSGDSCSTNPTSVGGPNLGSVDPYWTSWTFDAAGNRTKETQHKAGAATADTVNTYSYPTTTGAARPHATTQVATTGASTATTGFGYDNNGNLKSKTVNGTVQQTLTWDLEGHLATSTPGPTAGATTSSDVYEADGTRILRRDPATVTLYLPGDQELALNLAGNTVTGTRYCSVPEATAVRTSSDGKVRYLLADHHGTNNLSINATTMAFNRKKSSPYGALRGAAPAAWPGERGFVGGTTDTADGYTHIGAREYDPVTGRFLSPDPLIDLTDPTQMGGYAYSNHNPVSSSDPTGMMNMAFIDGGGDWTPTTPACDVACQAAQLADLGPSTSDSQVGNAVQKKKKRGFWDGVLDTGVGMIKGAVKPLTDLGGCIKGRDGSCGEFGSDLLNGLPPVAAYRTVNGVIDTYKMVDQEISDGEYAYLGGQVTTVIVVGALTKKLTPAPAAGVAAEAEAAGAAGAAAETTTGAAASATAGLPPLRLAYIGEVEALGETGAAMRAAGSSVEDIARALHQARRDIGVKYKDLTPEPLRSTIYERNIAKYGDPLGPTVDWLRAKGKSWEQIIEGATRTGGADLGLNKK
ncbi:RHS repeat-associated core domain-containing protein [Kitasatospora sp. NPDC048365]|uniref:RHS repeat-associated core domain-containing protein n=1 Tax=Kitasatospora sp. NPDC048365 TaxID=3364050 RepID=UPI00371EBEFC